MQIYDKYAQDVLDGKVVAGNYIKQAANRYLLLKNSGKYTFSHKKVQKVIKFISILTHFKGKSAGKHFILEPWQQFVVANIFGFLNNKGMRVMRSVYIEMARKNGKTAFAAAIALYQLIADGEDAAEVYLAANSSKQAKIAFQMCDNFKKSLDPKSQLLDAYRDKILFSTTNSQLVVLAADDSKLDGFDASTYILDEYHAAKNSRVREVLQSSQGAREQPLEIIITTAGFDKLGPCYQYREVCLDVLAGHKEDDKLGVFIFGLDEKDKWDDPNVWPKCNPNLGVSVREEYPAEQVVIAKNDPSATVGILTKNFNLWCDSSTVWIPREYLDTVIQDVSFDEFVNDTAFVGVDLAATGDLTCATFMRKNKDDKLVFKTLYYLPASCLIEKKDRELYKEWARNGYLIVTPGNVTNYDYILNDIRKYDKDMYIEKIGYDSWNATQFAINATELSLPMEPYSQSIGNFNKPTKELERLIRSGNVIIDNNPITLHCFRNVTIVQDRNNNQKPSKDAYEKKIDGIISICTALGVYLDSPFYAQTVTEE